METKKGYVDWFSEPGSEGAYWIFMEDGKIGWDATFFLEKGDYLVVYDENGEIVFDGEINPNYTIGWQEYPLNPGNGQQCALGYWVHWIQEGWQPDDWARLFIRYEGEKDLRAELKKGEEENE